MPAVIVNKCFVYHSIILYFRLISVIQIGQAWLMLSAIYANTPLPCETSSQSLPPPINVEAASLPPTPDIQASSLLMLSIDPPPVLGSAASSSGISPEGISSSSQVFERRQSRRSLSMLPLANQRPSIWIAPTDERPVSEQAENYVRVLYILLHNILLLSFYLFVLLSNRIS